jgi:hypothetical protein
MKCLKRKSVQMIDIAEIRCQNMERILSLNEERRQCAHVNAG